MKNNFFKHLSGGILALFLVLFCPMSVFAETVSGNEPVALAAGGVTRTTADETTWTVTKEGVTFKVTYPTVISCGTPVTFRFEALPAEGNVISDVKYRVYDLSIYDGTEGVFVYDTSNLKINDYKSDTTWDFTFCASGKYYISFNIMYMTSSGTYTYWNSGYGNNGIVLTINDPKYPSVEEIVEKVAAECQAQCTTDFDKAVWLNDWLVDHCKYDYSYSYCSAEGALARGTGTCEAYHRAYVMLLNQVGIATGRITGGGHVWTAVKLDGKWYQVDTTWNDTDSADTILDGERKHLYFGLNDAITTIVHSDHKPKSGYESNSLDDNYFIKTNKIAKWADPQKQAVQQHIDAGEANFSLAINNIQYADVLYSLVAHVLTNESWTANGQKVSLKAEYIPNRTEDGRIDTINGTISCQVQSSADTGGSSSGGNNSGGGSSSGGNNSGAGSSSGGGSNSGAGNNSGGGSSSGGGSNSGGGSSSGGGAAVGGAGIGIAGWTDSGIENGKPGVTVYRGLDYSPIYNFEYYLNRYPDIKSVFGNDEKAALNHFIIYGMKEGRSAQANFDVYFYRSSYPDLEAAFGDDLMSYFYHYINYGMKEGRMGIPQQKTKAG